MPSRVQPKRVFYQCFSKIANQPLTRLQVWSRASEENGLLISDNDLLEILSEVHQFTAILFEAENRSVFGIIRIRDQTPKYFWSTKHLGTHQQRLEFLQRMRAETSTERASDLTLDQFLLRIRGKRTRHIWLEQGTKPSKERGFVNIAELRAYLRGQPR